ncbi:uncharacterized protein L201_004758 [Kwoniella dendrophila CBS 6074]|uniref:Uncharacterized protein n=1 Tax=Kwoniella dendrophila CBS 6074 TaxID=1295534 RepID=A0AAX4JWK2_9TREE
MHHDDTDFQSFEDEDDDDSNKNNQCPISIREVTWDTPLSQLPICEDRLSAFIQNLHENTNTLKPRTWRRVRRKAILSVADHNLFLDTQEDERETRKDFISRVLKKSMKNPSSADIKSALSRFKDSQFEIYSNSAEDFNWNWEDNVKALEKALDKWGKTSYGITTPLNYSLNIRPEEILSLIEPTQEIRKSIMDNYERLYTERMKELSQSQNPAVDDITKEEGDNYLKVIRDDPESQKMRDLMSTIMSLDKAVGDTYYQSFVNPTHEFPQDSSHFGDRDYFHNEVRPRGGDESEFNALLSECD